jgi:hypothetical protein
MQPTGGLGPFGSDPSQPPPRRSWFQRAQLPITLVSVAIAIVAIGVMIYTIRSRPGNPPAISAGASTPATPSNTQTLEPTDSAAPTDTGMDTPSDSPLPAPTDSSTVQPRGSYVLAYQGTRMVVPCEGSTRVDLDEPHVDVATADDFAYCAFYVNQVPAIRTDLGHAVLKSANATPEECQQTIQLAPTTGLLATKAGLVYCQVTDGTQAVPGGGSSPKTCIIALTSIDPERRLNLTVTCYTNPT